MEAGRVGKRLIDEQSSPLDHSRSSIRRLYLVHFRRIFALLEPMRCGVTILISTNPSKEGSELGSPSVQVVLTGFIPGLSNSSVTSGPRPPSLRSKW